MQSYSILNAAFIKRAAENGGMGSTFEEHYDLIDDAALKKIDNSGENAMYGAALGLLPGLAAGATVGYFGDKKDRKKRMLTRAMQLGLLSSTAGAAYGYGNQLGFGRAMQAGAADGRAIHGIPQK